VTVAEVVVDNVRKSFATFEALKGVSARIADGEMLVILGPSGCGKSTLLRLIAGLEELTSGDIYIGERKVNRLEPKDRDIAMVFQNYALYPHMTVYDNMAYGLRNQKKPKAEIERRVQEAARILGLGDLLQRKPRQLSGGQRQRVAMGRAIVREPKVFLFDEPLSNLDAKLRVQMRLEIRHLQRRLRTTGIFVTHDQVEAMTLGDRLLVMDAGEVEQLGPPLEVYARPASVFVAGFIGSPAMNLVDARIEPDGAAVRVGDDLLPLPEPRPADGGRPVTLGLRPEHLRAVPEGETGLHIHIEWIESLGADTILHGRHDGDGVQLTARIEGGLAVDIGDRLVFTLPPERVQLFDRVGGRRLEGH
jgi:sn-glycerol 3-phosphate transport system ATP-binding protein